MKKPRNMTLIAVVVLILAASLVAFRPYGGDADDDGVSDNTEALAEALGMDVDTLQTAIETAKEYALSQAVADGDLTQEQADEYLSRSSSSGSMHVNIRGVDFDTYLADTLEISVEALQTAQREAADLMIDQALEDGSITQDEYDQLQLRSTMRSYFEEAYSSAYQNAIDAALADGAITEAQAELLLSDSQFGRQSFGGGRMHGDKHFHSNDTEADGD